LRRALGALALIVACKYPDPGVMGDGGPLPDEDGLFEDRAYVVVHRSLDTTSTKVAVLPAIEVFDEVDLSGARTFGANTQVFMSGSRVFVATDRTIKRYIVEGSTLVQDGGTIDFVSTAITRFSGVFVPFDDQNAWYFDHEHFHAFALNLESMSRSSEIYFTTLADTNLNPFPTGAYLVGDVVYMPYYYLNPTNSLFIESETYVAQFSYSAKSLSTMTGATTLRRTGCARLHPFAKLADGTQLFLGDSGSLSVLATPRPMPNCLRRIQTSEPNNMDFGFTIDMDSLTSPYLAATRAVQYDELVVTWTRASGTITSQSEWDTITRWVPQVTNLVDLHTEELANLMTLDNPIESMGAPGKTFFVEGEATFLIPKQVPADGTVLTNTSGTPIATFPGTLTWIERVR
jgi:hypothetical protein